MATEGETGFLHVSLGNLTSNMQRVKRGTLLGTATPVVPVHKAIPNVTPEQQTEKLSDANFVYKVYEQMNIDDDLTLKIVFRLNSCFSITLIRSKPAYRSAKLKNVPTRHYWHYLQAPKRNSTNSKTHAVRPHFP